MTDNDNINVSTFRRISKAWREAEPPDGSHFSNTVYAAINRYMAEGVAPGGFTKACLANDLRNAVSRADERRREELVQIVRFIGAHVPVVACGSWGAVSKWCQAATASHDEDAGAQ